MVTIDDYQTYSNDNYFEDILVRGNEFSLLEDEAALWNALSGELKTKVGECKCVGLENYGCELWRILGQNLDELVIKEIEAYIEALVPRYQEINALSLEEVIKYKDGSVSILIGIDSSFGKFRRGLVIGGPC
ncbi:MAG: hypothetical protein WA125_06235 [Desulfosporosinus sp.]